MNTVNKLLSVGLALAASGIVSCSIPRPECTVGQSSNAAIGLKAIAAFSTRYKLVSGSGECANFKGEVVGFQSYHPATEADPLKRDFSRTSIAIRPMSLGEIQWMNEDLIGPAEQFCYDVDDAGKPVDDDGDGLANMDDPDCHVNAFGDFTTTEPDANNMCSVASATQHVIFPGASVPMDTGNACDPANGDMDCMGTGTCTPNDPMDPMAGGECFATVDLAAIDLQYDWTNISIYVTAAAVGTQFSADLKITLKTAAGDSTCTYKAVGMWPAADCGVHDPETDAVTGTDPALCISDADPKNGRPVGSGINPDFGPVICDTGVALPAVVDQYYTQVNTPDGLYNTGIPLSVPRCALDAESIPALSPAAQ